MSEAGTAIHGAGTAVSAQLQKRLEMLPGSARDRRMAAAKRIVPAAAALLFLGLILWPLGNARELSFLLSKEGSGLASERMRITRASYRGVTDSGEPFEITAESAVQKSSQVPVVMLSGLAARIDRAEGPATVTAPGGAYHLETSQLEVMGGIEARGAGGYELQAQKVLVDIAENRVSSATPVSGQLPMGSFSANRFEADIPGRHVVLDGQAKLRITPARGGG
jgi:lipopolysaccharide export system protein LptC